MKVIENGPNISFVHEHGQAEGLLLLNASYCIFIHSSSVDYQQRNKGLGKTYHQERLDWIKKQGYITDAFCLVYNGNTAEEKIMECHGWKKVDITGLGVMTMYHKII